MLPEAHPPEGRHGCGHHIWPWHASPSSELWGRLALNTPRGTTCRAWGRAAPRPPSLTPRPAWSSQACTVESALHPDDTHEVCPRPPRPRGAHSGRKWGPGPLRQGSSLPQAPPDWAPQGSSPGSTHTAAAPESSGHPSALWRRGVCLPVPALGGPGTCRCQQLRDRSAPDGRGSSGQWVQPCHRTGVDPPACTGCHGVPHFPVPPRGSRHDLIWKQALCR